MHWLCNECFLVWCNVPPPISWFAGLLCVIFPQGLSNSVGSSRGQLLPAINTFYHTEHAAQFEWQQSSYTCYNTWNLWFLLQLKEFCSHFATDFCHWLLAHFVTYCCWILMQIFFYFDLLGRGSPIFQPQVFWCEVEISFNFSVLTSKNLIWNKQTNKISTVQWLLIITQYTRGTMVFVSKHVVSFFYMFHASLHLCV